MSTIHSLIAACQFNRTRTIGLLDQIEKAPNPQEVLAWRPGPGRAHIGWQLTHIGITEELFATERLERPQSSPFPELILRFKGGSTPDDDVPSPALIRQVLIESRARLLDTLSNFGDKQLGWVPAPLKERNFSLLDVMHILAWHEGHHQGQAHITFNLYRGRQAS
jgi:hypothetical protein